MGKSPWYLLGKRLGEHHSWSGHGEEENSSPPGNRPLTFNMAAIRYDPEPVQSSSHYPPTSTAKVVTC